MSNLSLQEMSRVLETPQAQRLYNALCDKCGTAWVSQNVSGPKLAAWLAALHRDAPPAPPRSGGAGQGEGGVAKALADVRSHATWSSDASLLSTALTQAYLSI
jgi:hypothetical protein